MKTGWMVLVWACELAILSSTADALELRWASGQSDLAFAEARQCTLLLCANSRNEELPVSWRLGYLIEGQEQPVRFEDDFSEPGVVGVCTRSSRGSDQLSLLQHCSLYSTTRARCARYIFALAGNAQATFQLVTRGSEVTTLGVTTNGGTRAPAPPLAAHTTLTTDGSALVVEVWGTGMDYIAKVRLTHADFSAPVQMQILEQTPNLIRARVDNAAGIGKAAILLLDAQDRGDVVEFSPEDENEGGIGAQDHLIVRFANGAVQTPPGRTGGSLSEHVFRSTAVRDSLQARGVVGLERLFPWFRREDVHSKNLIGEGVILEDLSDTYVANVLPGIDQLSACLALRNVPGIYSVGVDPRIPALHQPDPLWQYQWGLANTGQSIVCPVTPTPNIDINPEGAWLKTRGLGASIAIIDAGTDLHPDISGCSPCTPACPWCGARRDTSFVPGAGEDADQTSMRHGNAVASLAMARSDNGTCIVGVAEDATTWAIKVVGGTTNPTTTPARVAAAIDYARMKNRGTMNLSLGFTDQVFNPSVGTKQALADACLNAFYAGHLLVASMGNDNDSIPKYPAGFRRRACGVGAVDIYGGWWNDAVYGGASSVASTYGSWTDLAAPGGRFVVAARRNHTSDQCHDLSNCGFGDPSHFGGTSAAAPLVTGVAALLKAYNPNLLGEDIEQIMKRSTVDVAFPDPATTGYDVHTGWGIVQADGALDYITPPRFLRQKSVGFQGTSGTLSIADSSATVNIIFLNRPGRPSPELLTAKKFKLSGTGVFGAGYISPPAVWIRSSGSMGWDDVTTFDYHQDVMWGRVDSGTLTSTSATFETYVYRIAGTPELWFPCPPESARVAYTTVGLSPGAVAVEPREVQSLALRLNPNPAIGGLAIEFTMPADAVARLDVLDLAGRVVATLAHRELKSGMHRFVWDGKGRSGGRSAAGVYICRLRIAGRNEVKKFSFVASGK